MTAWEDMNIHQDSNELAFDHRDLFRTREEELKNGLKCGYYGTELWCNNKAKSAM